METTESGEKRMEGKGKKEKAYSESEVCVIVTEMAMDMMGDEWVPQCDEGFLDWLINKGLHETWKGIYGDAE